MRHNRNCKKDIDITNQPAKYMDHSSSSEANSSSASQELKRILRNPQVHGSCPQQPATCPYPEVDESCPCFPILLFSIHFNIILRSMHRSSKLSPSFGFLHKNSVCTSPLSQSVIWPVHFILLDLFARMHRLRISPLCYLLQFPVYSHLLDPNIFLSTVFSITLSL